MGVIYDFNQQVVATDNDYDVVKEVPAGFVLYKLETPYFAFFPGQFVGVRNGIKVNAQNSMWILEDINSYFAKYGTDRRVIENLPNEYKEELKKRAKILVQMAQKIQQKTTGQDNTTKEEKNELGINFTDVLDQSGLKLLFDKSSVFLDFLNATNHLDFLRKVVPSTLFFLREISNSESFKNFFSDVTLADLKEKNILFELEKQLLLQIRSNNYDLNELNRVARILMFIKDIPVYGALKILLTSYGKDIQTIENINLRQLLNSLFAELPDNIINILKQNYNSLEAIRSVSTIFLGKLNLPIVNIFKRTASSLIAASVQIPGYEVPRQNLLSDAEDYLVLNFIDSAKVILAEVYGLGNPDYVEEDILTAFLQLCVDEITSNTAINDLVSLNINFNTSDFFLILKNYLEKIKNTPSSENSKALLTVFVTALQALLMTQDSPIAREKMLLSVINKFTWFINNPDKINEFYKKSQNKIDTNIFISILNSYLLENSEKLLLPFLEKESVKEKPLELQSEVDSNTDELFLNEKLKDLTEVTTAEEEDAIVEVSDEKSLYRYISEKIAKVIDFATLHENSALNPFEKFLFFVGRREELRNLGEHAVQFLGENFYADDIIYAACSDLRLFHELSFSKETILAIKEDIPYEELQKYSLGVLSEKEKELYLYCFRLLKKNLNEISEDEIKNIIDFLNKNITNEETLYRYLGILTNAFRGKFVTTLSNMPSIITKNSISGFENIFDYIIDKLDLAVVYPRYSSAYIHNIKQKFRYTSFSGLLGFKYDLQSAKRLLIEGMIDSLRAISSLIESEDDLQIEVVKEVAKLKFNTELDYVYSFERLQRIADKLFDEYIARAYNHIMNSPNSFESANSLSLAVLGKLLVLSSNAATVQLLLADPRKSFISYSTNIFNRIYRESAGFFVRYLEIANYIQNVTNKFNKLGYIVYASKNKEALTNLGAVAFRNFRSKVLKYFDIKCQLEEITEEEFFPRPYINFSVFNNEIHADLLKSKKLVPMIGTYLFFGGLSKLLATDPVDGSGAIAMQSLIKTQPETLTRFNFFNEFINTSDLQPSTAVPVFDLTQSSFYDDDFFDKVTDVEVNFNPVRGSYPNACVFTFKLPGDVQLNFSLYTPSNVFPLFLTTLLSQLYTTGAIEEPQFKKLTEVVNLARLALKKDFDSPAKVSRYKKLVQLPAYVAHLQFALRNILMNNSSRRVFFSLVRFFGNILGTMDYKFDNRYIFSHISPYYGVTTPSCTSYEDFIRRYFDTDLEDFYYQLTKNTYEIFKSFPEEQRDIILLAPLKLLKPSSIDYLGFTINKALELNDTYSSNYRTAVGVSPLSPIFLSDRPDNGLYEMAKVSRPGFVSLSSEHAARKFFLPGQVEIAPYEKEDALYMVTSNARYSARGYNTFITTIFHELGHVLFYDLPIKHKKRGYVLFLEKYVAPSLKLFKEIESKAPKDKTKLLTEAFSQLSSLFVQIMKAPEEQAAALIAKADNISRMLDDALISLFASIGEKYIEKLEKFSDEIMTPYSVSSFYELYSTALDHYLRDREKFIKEFPLEYKIIVLPLLQKLYELTDYDLTINNMFKGQPVIFDVDKKIEILYEKSRQTLAQKAKEKQTSGIIGKIKQIFKKSDKK